MTSRVRPVIGEVEIGGIRLGYGTMAGSGPPLVLLHGIGARWQVYRPLMLAVQDSYRQWAPDLRGHGISSRAADYGIGEFATDIADFVDKVVGEPVHLCGHSMGGWVALFLAAHRPDLVRSLVIADSGIYLDEIPRERSETWLSRMPLTLRSMAKSLEQFDREVLAQYHDYRMTRDYRPGELLARVACPALLLQGDPARDAFMTDDDVRRALALIPDVGHRRLDGIGHDLHVEDACLVATAIREFHRSIPEIRSR